MSRSLYLNGAILDGALANFSAYTKLSVPTNTAADAAARRDYVDSKVLEQKARIDAILVGAGVNLDNLREIADFINSLDAAQQLDILNKVATLNDTITTNKEASELRDANLRTDLETEASARAAAVSSEQTRATAAETLVQSNLNTLSALQLKQYNQHIAFQEIDVPVRNVSAVYADGSSALVPENVLLVSKQGWYYKKSNAVGNKKHNWYMPVPAGLKVKHLKSLQLHAEISTTSPLHAVGDVPFFGVYTAKLNDGKDMGSWYRSRINWGTDFLNINGTYEGNTCFRVKLDASREHIPNGDYTPVEYSLNSDNRYSTGSTSLADIGEEFVSKIHVSSNSSAAAYQEYFIHSFKMQLEAHTQAYRFEGADVDIENRVSTLNSDLNTARTAFNNTLTTTVTERNAAIQALRDETVSLAAMETAARLNAIQQEANQRELSIQTEANARAIKDGEHAASITAEQAARAAAVAAEEAARQAAVAAEEAAREAAVAAEQVAREAADAAEANSRIMADNNIMAIAASHKTAADLTASYVSELYKYFNQTYASVYTFNNPINLLINNSSYIPPFDNANWQHYTAANYLPDFTIAARASSTTIMGFSAGADLTIRRLQFTVHLPLGLGMDGVGRWVMRYKFEQKVLGGQWDPYNMPNPFSQSLGYQQNGELLWFTTDLNAVVTPSPPGVSIAPGTLFRCSASYDYPAYGEFSLNQPDQIKYSKEFTYGL